MVIPNTTEIIFLSDNFSMKIYFIISMAFIFLNLNLFAMDLSPEEQEKFETTKRNFELWRLTHPDVSLEEYSQQQSDVAPCTHCPAPHALLSSVLPILKSLPNAKEMQPIGELELQYAIERLNGGVNCRDMIQTFDDQFQMRKFDGQFIQIAEGIFEKYSSIAQVAYQREGVDEAIYYYRDGADHIVQVIVDKNGKARFRYYQYIAKEGRGQNTPELPEFGNTSADKQDLLAFPKVEPIVSQNKFDGKGGVKGNYSSSLHADLVPRGGALKFIPRDLKFYEATGELGYNSTTISGKVASAVSRGNEVQLSVVSGDENHQDALVTYRASTSTLGEFKEQKIAIPLRLNLGDSVGVSGEIAEVRQAGRPGSHARTMVMEFFEPAAPGGEAPRREYVTVNVVQANGKPVTYDLKKAIDTGDSLYTAAVGKETTGNFVGVGYSPKKNPKGESLMVKFVNENGRLAGYATYSIASDFLK